MSGRAEDDMSRTRKNLPHLVKMRLSRGKERKREAKSDSILFFPFLSLLCPVQLLFMTLAP